MLILPDKSGKSTVILDSRIRLFLRSDSNPQTGPANFRSSKDVVFTMIFEYLLN